MSENEVLRNKQGFSKLEIRDEIKYFVSNEVKVWNEENEKDKTSFKEILEQQKIESKVRMGKKKSLKSDAAEKNCFYMWIKRKGYTYQNKER